MGLINLTGEEKCATCGHKSYPYGKPEAPSPVGPIMVPAKEEILRAFMEAWDTIPGVKRNPGLLFVHACGYMLDQIKKRNLL